MTQEEYYRLPRRERMPYEEWCRYYIPTQKKTFITPFVNPARPKKLRAEDFSKYKRLYEQSQTLSKLEQIKKDNGMPDELDLRC